MSRKATKPKPSRAELNRLRVTAPDLTREVDHFYQCPACGQAVDRPQLGDVLWHEEAGHDPIPLELAFLEPMLPTLVAAPPQGDDWIHEIKYESYRTQLGACSGRELQGSCRQELRPEVRDGGDFAVQCSFDAPRLFMAGAFLFSEPPQ